MIQPAVSIEELKAAGLIDPYVRIQGWELTIAKMFPPREDGRCACGCGCEIVKPRRRWASDNCSAGAALTVGVIKGHGSSVRSAIWERDKGICAECGAEPEWDRALGQSDWHADHIIEVADGGGGCDLTNYQTLCSDCHKAKTQRSRRARSEPVEASE